MSRLLQRPRLDLDVALVLTEPEVRALDALTGYGVKSFLEVFYERMGEYYLKPHEDGLRSLFDTVRSELPPILKRLDAAKTAFALRDPVVRSRAEHNELVRRLQEGQP